MKKEKNAALERAATRYGNKHYSELAGVFDDAEEAAGCIASLHNAYVAGALLAKRKMIRALKAQGFASGFIGHVLAAVNEEFRK